MRLIHELFTKGHSFIEYPFRVVWIEGQAGNPVQPRILISVSKRYHKKAVTRNLLKRRIREAYRKNKESFCERLKVTSGNLNFGLLYISHEIMDYRRIEQKIILVLQRLIAKGE